METEYIPLALDGGRGSRARHARGCFIHSLPPSWPCRLRRRIGLRRLPPDRVDHRLVFEACRLLHRDAPRGSVVTAVHLAFVPTVVQVGAARPSPEGSQIRGHPMDICPRGAPGAARSAPLEQPIKPETRANPGESRGEPDPGSSGSPGPEAPLPAATGPAAIAPVLAATPRTFAARTSRPDEPESRKNPGDSSWPIESVLGQVKAAPPAPIRTATPGGGASLLAGTALVPIGRRDWVLPSSAHRCQPARQFA